MFSFAGNISDVVKDDGQLDLSEIPALIAQILNVFEVLGQCSVTSDDGSVNYTGEAVLLKRPTSLRLKHVENVRQEEITKEVGSLTRQLSRHVIDGTHQNAGTFETMNTWVTKLLARRCQCGLLSSKNE